MTAERSMLVRRVMFRERQNPEGERFPASDIDGCGRSSADVLEAWIEQLDSTCVSDPSSSRLIIVDSKCVSCRDGCLIRFMSGTYGELSDLVDVNTLRTIQQIGEDVAPTALHRAFFLVPEAGEHALFFYEESTRGSGGLRILQSFKRWWNASGLAPYLEEEAVMERNAWLAQVASVSQVEIRSFKRADDSASSPLEEVGYYSYSVHPPKGKRWSKKLLDCLVHRPEYANELVGLDRVVEMAESKVYVSLNGQDGRTIKYVIGDYDSGTTIREVLNSHGEAMLTDDEFVERCRQTGQKILHQMNVL